jgi:hypothetical protein
MTSPNSNDIYQQYSLSRVHSDWSVLMAQSHRLYDDSFYMNSLMLARQIMRRVRDILLNIIDELYAENYRFAGENIVYKPPPSNTFEWIKELTEQGIHFPVSLQAWLLEVGSVNLMGSHPEWLKTAYVFDVNKPTSDVWYTDPLVVEVTEDFISEDSISYLYDEWLQKQEESDRRNCPFRIPISPDHIHKANVSGGEPYEIAVDCPTVDSFIFNERNCMSFVGYIRLALRWGGFPGFLYIHEPDLKFMPWKYEEKLLI